MRARRIRPLLAAVLGAALCAAGQLRADRPLARTEQLPDARPEPRPAGGSPAPPPRATAPGARAPLSAEDAALVEQLALLEKVDLLKHLELFEREEQAGRARKPRQPEQRQQ